MNILLKEIHKQFISGSERIQALRGVSLEIKGGEFFTLLGPSGCGKTTLLRCIAGLERPDQGEITVGGKLFFSHSPLQALPSHQRNIGMVFQSYAIWPHMSVFENVAYPLRYGEHKRFTKEEIRSRVVKSLARVHMDSLADRPATQLSGGQQQRVALARALVNDPQVVLLDEPLVNLDAKLREEMRAELRDLLHGLGTTVVYVTHDQAEALNMSDRMAILVDGQVMQIGTPVDIYNCPSTEFVAGFVGTSNLLRGSVKRDSSHPSGIILQSPIGRLECEGLDVIREGEEGNVIVRPEDIQLFRPTKLQESNLFRGRIRRREFLGDSVTAFVQVADVILRVKLHPGAGFAIDEEVDVRISPERCCVLGRYAKGQNMEKRS